MNRTLLLWQEADISKVGGHETITNLLFLASKHSLTQQDPAGRRHAWQRPKPRRWS